MQPYMYLTTENYCEDKCKCILIVLEVGWILGGGFLMLVMASISHSDVLILES